MLSKKLAALTALAALALSSACSMPGNQPTPVEATQGPAIPLDTQVAAIVEATLAAGTQIAIAGEETLAAGTQIAITGEATRSALTPEFTFTPSLTATQTDTPTPEVPMLSVSQLTNCRTGPGTVYDKLGVINVGEKAQLVGSNADRDTWVIKLPSNPAITCWIWGLYASVEGNIAGLPVVPVPPTPTPLFTRTPTGTLTPQSSFSLAFASTDYCLGLYRIKFKITNTGAVTWESNRVSVTDENLNLTLKVSRDKFLYYSSNCGELGDFNLEKGEIGFTTSEGFAANPRGHAISATVRVCSQDGLTGTCQAQTISFKP